MKNKLIPSIIVILACALLSWGWQHHKIRAFPAHTSSLLAPAFDPQEKGVDIYVELLSTEESKELLGHDLLNKGIQPLHFTIHNNSATSYRLSEKGVDLKQIEGKKIAKKLYKQTIPRAVAFKIMSFLFWPFTIPSTVDSVHSFYSYKKMRKDFALKSLREEIIPVYATFHRILFVPKEAMKERFQVTLIEEKGNEPLVLTIQQHEPRPLNTQS